MTDLVIEINGLRKSFGKFEALRGLDMQVQRGQVHGFLGPNGAGKSTTIRVLLGLLRADAGQVRLLDGDPWRDVVALHRRLAYVPGDVSLWPSMTGGEAIGDTGNVAAQDTVSGVDAEFGHRAVRGAEVESEWRLGQVGGALCRQRPGRRQIFFDDGNRSPKNVDRPFRFRLRFAHVPMVSISVNDGNTGFSE